MTALIMTADEKQRIIEQGNQQNEVASRPMTIAEKIKYGIPVDEETRTCKRCGETKPLADFTKHNKDKSGYSHVCKACATGGRVKIEAPVEITFSHDIETLRAENAELRQMLEGAKSTVMELREGMKLQDSGNRTHFDSGAVRDMGEGKGRCDLLPPRGLLRLARHFENGAVKYGDRNWERGIPIHSFIDSGIRHLLKYAAGETDEDHLCAAAWNIVCAMDTEERMPEMQDIPARLEAMRE